MAQSTDKPSREHLSKTPSWIMLGFVLGCLFAFTIKHELESMDETAAVKASATATSPARAEPEPQANTVTALKDRPSLTAIEDIFIESKSSAVWEAELTEVALWNPATGKHSDFFEVSQNEGNYYFRSIPRLTRPLIDPEQNNLKAILFTGLLPSPKNLPENSTLRTFFPER